MPNRDAFSVVRVCIPDKQQRALIDDAILQINALLEKSPDVLMHMEAVQYDLNSELLPFSVEVIVSQYMGIGWHVTHRPATKNVFPEASVHGYLLIRPKTSKEINREP